MDQEEKKLERHLEALTNAIEKTYGTTNSLVWRSFLSGLMSGLGATIGVSIVVIIIGYLIRHFGGLPVIGDWLGQLNQVLPSRR